MILLCNCVVSAFFPPINVNIDTSLREEGITVINVADVGRFLMFLEIYRVLLLRYLRACNNYCVRFNVSLLTFLNNSRGRAVQDANAVSN